MQEIFNNKNNVVTVKEWSSKYLQELIVGGGRARKCEG